MNYRPIQRHIVCSTGTIIATCVFHKAAHDLVISPNGGFRCHVCEKTGHVMDHPPLRLLFDQVGYKRLEEAGQLRLPGF